MQKPQSQICSVLNQIIAKLDTERSQLKMNEEEESTKSIKKVQCAKKQPSEEKKGRYEFGAGELIR